MNPLTDFTRRYAILMPDGQLWRTPMQNHFGLFFNASEAPPAIFHTRGDAEHALYAIRVGAAEIGIEWLGVIVESYCSPFTASSVDPAARFANDIEAWLTQQHRGGGQ